MTALVLDHPRELPRWLLSGAIVLALHGAITAALIQWRDADDGGDPTAALVINLAPMPVSPALTPADMPPGPEQVQAEAAREVPQERVTETTEEKTDTAEVHEVQPELAPAINPEVVLDQTPPKPQAEAPAPEVNEIPAPATTTPQVLQREVAPVAAAPVQAPASTGDPNAVPTWTRQVVKLLEQNKRYPSASRARGDKGTVQLAFSLDREGRVVASRIVKSSGSATLDQETLDLVRRTQPFPRPPAAMPGAQVELTIPVQYKTR